MMELRGLSHGFLRKSLFHNVNMRFLPRERYGIVGANGSGKSTLLRIMAGEIEQDEGEVVIDAHKSLFCIGQEYKLDNDILIIDAAMMGQKQLYDALKRKEYLLASHDSDHAKDLVEIEEFIISHDGYRLKSSTETILAGLGIETKDHHNKVATLSGGYAWRVFLAQALVKKPDILMLDEPTNHLDIISIRWLEMFLQNYHGLIILVSHDKRFMDNVCTKIMDIDFDTIMTYSGNYTQYEKARALFMLQKEKEIEAQTKEIAKKQEFIDRFKAKATKARQAQSRIKQIEKMDIIEPIKTSRCYPHLRFDIAEAGSKEILNVKHLVKKYGDKTIINDFSFTAMRGDKIAIIGPNGSGKSTLIKALALTFADTHKYISWGFNASVGYFPQDIGSIIKNSAKSVLEWLWQYCAHESQSYVQGFLGRVLFSGEDAKKDCAHLSGGEASRLYLAYLMMKKHNVLLLDEPTNHLDLESIYSLTKALVEFKGTVILVSHDRTFIDSVAQRIIEITPHGISEFLGCYSEFIAFRERDYLDAQEEALLAKNNSSKDSKKSSYAEQKKQRAEEAKLKRDRDKILIDIEILESNIAKIDEQFLASGFFTDHDFNAIKSLESTKHNYMNELDSLMKKWEAIEYQLKQYE